MKLKAYVAKTDEGTASYAVDWMGKTYPVDPGQKSVAIDGVIFTVEGNEEPEKEEKPAKNSKKK